MFFKSPFQGGSRLWRIQETFGKKTLVFDGKTDNLGGLDGLPCGLAGSRVGDKAVHLLSG